MSSADNLNVKHLVVPENELNELPCNQIHCWLCGIKVKNKSNLRAHQIKTHRILRHYQIVHMEKLYKCEQCGSRYPTPSALSYHRRLCGNFHFCPVCSRAYSYKKHLYQHFRRSGHAVSPSKASKPCRLIPPSISFIQPKAMEELNTYIPDKPSAQISSITGLTAPLATSTLTFPSLSTVATPSVQNNSTFPVSPNTTILVNFVVIPGNQAQSSQPIPQLLTPNVASVLTPDTLPCTSADTSVVSRCCGTSQTITQDFSMQTEQFSWPSPSSVVKESGVQSELMDVFDLISTSTGDFLPATPGILDSSTAPAGSTVSVSVNTGTDEDDITSFIGSLFCDASVETNFSMPQLVNDFTDTGLDLLGELCPPSDSPRFAESTLTSPTGNNVGMQFCSPPCDNPRFVSTMSQAAALMRDSEQQHQSDDYLFQPLADGSVQTAQFFRYSSLATPAHEHASMQTEQVVRTHAAASTDELAPSSLYHYLRSSLDIP